MEVDADGNGSIEFAEFIELMRHHYLEVDLRNFDIDTCGKLLIQLSFSGISRKGFRFISINRMPFLSILLQSPKEANVQVEAVYAGEQGGGPEDRLPDVRHQQ